MLEKRYISEEQESHWQKVWAEEGTYRFDTQSAKPVYSIDTPPPTVSGNLHIGHIFSYTQAEMVARHRRMTGYEVYYPFGFDDNGLPTERLIERETGTDTRTMARGDVLALGKPIVEKQETAFRELWQSLGFSCDWHLAYRTMSAEVQKLSQSSFLDLARQNLAYAAEQPTLWCPLCRTSLAQADLDAKETETCFNTLRFPFREHPSKVLSSASSSGNEPGNFQITEPANTDIPTEGGGFGESPAKFLPVATTRPEMLYGCVALFIHPEHPEYAGCIGGTATVPLYGHEVPILANPEADPAKGTGIVMCCTFGDAADAAWYRTYELPYRKVLEQDGTLAAVIPEIGGLTISKARAVILDQLSAGGFLLKQEPMSHQVGIHERCGTETELLPSRQWYIRILDNKERFLHAADEMNWHPVSMKTRYLDWVSGLKWDWCVSRQRRYGIPIPVWYCRDCGTILLADEANLPVNPVGTHPEKPCPHCGGDRFEPETGVLDTWATSSITPQINAVRHADLVGHSLRDRHLPDEADMAAGPPFSPMSMRTQAHEIIRTWAFYTIVRSLYAENKIPWRDIMICGYIMAGKGEKLSKSKNNAPVEPTELIRIHSADAVRYWAAGARLGTDMTFKPEELALSRRFMTKLWNAARFSSIHLDTLSDEDWETADMQPADLWITARFNKALAEVSAAFSQYEAGEARKLLDAFFWGDFCDDWLELVKDRLYKPEVHGAAETAGAKVTLYRILGGILKLYAPFVPHLAESIHQSIYGIQGEAFRSIHNLAWETLPVSQPDLHLQLGEMLRMTLAEARRQKTVRGLSMKDPLSSLMIVGWPSEIPTEGLSTLRSLAEKSRGDLRACTGAGLILFPWQS